MFTNLIYKKFKQVEGDMVAYYPFGFCFRGMILKESEAQNLEQKFSRRLDQLFIALTVFIIMFILNAFVKFLPDVIQNYMVEIMFFVVALFQSIHILFFFRAKRQSIKSIPFSYHQAEEYILHEISFNFLVFLCIFFFLGLTAVLTMEIYTKFEEISLIPLFISSLGLIVFGWQLFVVLKSRMIKRKYNV